MTAILSRVSSSFAGEGCFRSAGSSSAATK
jgi:hypothetical protein